MSKAKVSSISIPGESVKKLNDIKVKRKKEKNLSWTHTNILVELINKEHKKEIKE